MLILSDKGDNLALNILPSVQDFQFSLYTKAVFTRSYIIFIKFINIIKTTFPLKKGSIMLN